MKIDIGKISHSTRVKIGALLLLMLTSLLTNLNELRRNGGFNPQTIGPDEVTLHEKRFAELKKALPPRGVIGYVSDETDPNEETKKYYLTQYTLTPVLVVRGAERHLVVGNFSDTEKAAPAPGGALVLLKDFGNGVVLYSQETR